MDVEAFVTRYPKMLANPVVYQKAMHFKVEIASGIKMHIRPMNKLEEDVATLMNKIVKANAIFNWNQDLLDLPPPRKGIKPVASNRTLSQAEKKKVQQLKDVQIQLAALFPDNIKEGSAEDFTVGFTNYQHRLMVRDTALATFQRLKTDHVKFIRRLAQALRIDPIEFYPKDSMVLVAKPDQPNFQQAPTAEFAVEFMYNPPKPEDCLTHLFPLKQFENVQWEQATTAVSRAAFWLEHLQLVARNLSRPYEDIIVALLNESKGNPKDPLLIGNSLGQVITATKAARAEFQGCSTILPNGLSCPQPRLDDHDRCFQCLLANRDTEISVHELNEKVWVTAFERNYRVGVSETPEATNIPLRDVLPQPEYWYDEANRIKTAWDKYGDLMVVTGEWVQEEPLANNTSALEARQEVENAGGAYISEFYANWLDAMGRIHRWLRQNILFRLPEVNQRPIFDRAFRQMFEHYERSVGAQGFGIDVATGPDWDPLILKQPNDQCLAENFDPKSPLANFTYLGTLPKFDHPIASTTEQKPAAFWNLSMKSGPVKYTLQLVYGVQQFTVQNHMKGTQSYPCSSAINTGCTRTDKHLMALKAIVNTTDPNNPRTVPWTEVEKLTNVKALKQYLGISANMTLQEYLEDLVAEMTQRVFRNESCHAYFNGVENNDRNMIAAGLFKNIVPYTKLLLAKLAKILGKAEISLNVFFDNDASMSKFLFMDNNSDWFIPTRIANMDIPALRQYTPKASDIDVPRSQKVLLGEVFTTPFTLTNYVHTERPGIPFNHNDPEYNGPLSNPSKNRLKFGRIVTLYSKFYRHFNTFSAEGLVTAAEIANLTTGTKVLNVAIPVLHPINTPAAGRQLVTRQVPDTTTMMAWDMSSLQQDPILRMAQISVLWAAEERTNRFGTVQRKATNLPVHWDERPDPAARLFLYRTFPLVVDQNRPKRVLPSSVERMALASAQVLNGLLTDKFPHMTHQPAPMRMFGLPPVINRPTASDINFTVETGRKQGDLFANTGAKFKYVSVKYMRSNSTSSYPAMYDRDGNLITAGLGQRFTHDESHRDQTLTQRIIQGENATGEEDINFYEMAMTRRSIVTRFPLTPFAQQMMELKERMIAEAKDINFRGYHQLPQFLFAGDTKAPTKADFDEELILDLQQVKDQETWLEFILCRGRSYLLTVPQAEKLVWLIETATGVNLRHLVQVVTEFWTGTHFRLLFGDSTDWTVDKSSPDLSPKSPVKKLMDIMDGYAIAKAQKTSSLNSGQLTRWAGDKDLPKITPPTSTKPAAISGNQLPAPEEVMVRPPSNIAPVFQRRPVILPPTIDWQHFWPPQNDESQTSLATQMGRERQREEMEREQVQHTARQIVNATKAVQRLDLGRNAPQAKLHLTRAGPARDQTVPTPAPAPPSTPVPEAPQVRRNSKL